MIDYEDECRRLRKRLEIERKARLDAESFGERKTRELFEANQELIRLNHSLEDEVRQHTDELHASKGQLRESHNLVSEALRFRDEFLASMTHELRSPLHAILGLSEAVLDRTFGELTPEQQKSLSTIQSSARHLQNLIEDVLDLSRIQAGKVELEMAPLEPEKAARSALDLVGRQAQNSKVKLELELGPNLRPIATNQRRLHQILVNLLQNAIKFSPPQSTVTLRVRWDAEYAALCFTVLDQGIGIEAADFVRLFQPFSQVDGTRSRRYGGTGLGLMLVRRMTELLGGSVRAASDPGKGSQFSVLLPDAPEPSPVAPVPAAASGATALVVEDNPINRLQLTRLLRRLGYEVAEAVDGILGLETARSLQPQIIFMDLDLPHLGGLDAIRLLRSDPRTRESRIIVVSGLTVPGTRERCLTAGANGYLEKPVTLIHLRAALDRKAGDLESTATRSPLWRKK